AICIAVKFSIPFLVAGPVIGSRTPIRMGSWARAIAMLARSERPARTKVDSLNAVGMIISADIGVGSWMVTPRAVLSHCIEAIRTIRPVYIRKRASTGVMSVDDEPDAPQFSVRASGGKMLARISASVQAISSGR